MREYPQGDLAAQVLGYVGEVPKEDSARLAKRAYYEPGDQIGHAGVEAVFESVLRGRPRRETIEVDPTGRQVGAPVKIEPGAVGKNVYLTIDANVQRAAEKSLAEGIARRCGHFRTSDVKTRFANFKAPAGAVVVLDASDGSVVALARATRRIRRRLGRRDQPDQDFDAITNPASNYPLLNRATQGQYAPGSTFKLVTSLAMTHDGDPRHRRLLHRRRQGRDRRFDVPQRQATRCSAR